MLNHRNSIPLLAAMLIGAVSCAFSADKFDAAKATGSIKGTVTLDGTAPKMKKIDMSGTAQCAALHKDAVTKEEVLVKDGKIANVVVYVKTVNGKKPEEVWAFDVPTTHASIDQKGCMYTPHILAVQANQPVDIVSSDDLAHNIHYVPGENKEFNESQQKAGSKKEVTFPEPEIGANIVCNIHAWMKAYLCVFPHALFAVTKEDGSFEIKVPAGEYEVAVWQESANDTGKLAPADPVKIKVADGEAKTQDFKLKAK
jgi:plastocyanin